MGKVERGQYPQPQPPRSPPTKCLCSNQGQCTMQYNYITQERIRKHKQSLAPSFFFFFFFFFFLSFFFFSSMRHICSSLSLSNDDQSTIDPGETQERNFLLCPNQATGSSMILEQFHGINHAVTSRWICGFFVGSETHERLRPRYNIVVVS